jgi:hypothetical protein
MSVLHAERVLFRRMCRTLASRLQPAAPSSPCQFIPSRALSIAHLSSLPRRHLSPCSTRLQSVWPAEKGHFCSQTSPSSEYASSSATDVATSRTSHIHAVDAAHPDDASSVRASSSAPEQEEEEHQHRREHERNEEDPHPGEEHEQAHNRKRVSLLLVCAAIASAWVMDMRSRPPFALPSADDLLPDDLLQQAVRSVEVLQLWQSGSFAFSPGYAAFGQRLAKQVGGRSAGLRAW